MDKTNATSLIMVVDGGGSTCRARLVDHDGNALGAAKGGAANAISDPESARRTIIATVRATYADAGLDPNRARDDLLFVALAGIPERTGFTALLSADMPFARIELTSDLAAGVQAALHDADGVVVNVGTGSYFVAQRGGRLRRVGGRGFLISDECSGAWLGQRLLRDVVRAHDRLIAATPLTDQALAECGGGIDDVVAFAKRASPRDFAGFAPMIVAARAQADPVAERLFARAVNEMCAILDALDAVALGRIVLIGGLAATYRALLPEPWHGLCRDPLGDTLDGAVRLAQRAAMGETA